MTPGDADRPRSAALRLPPPLAEAGGLSGGTALPDPPGDPLAIKCQCAEVWAHPAAQLLLGRSLRPGGTALTEQLLSQVDLPPRSVVLDVGCGPGTTLEVIAAAGHHGLGVDYSLVNAADAAAPTAPTPTPTPVAVAGDAERLPIGSAAVDAALIECVVSALPDKAAAVAELQRVIRPGGWLILTDMTLADQFPEPLNTALAWVACAAGALSVAGYVELIEATGFEVVSVEDRSPDLAAMVARARRRLALVRGASGIGLLPPLAEIIGPDLSALAAVLLGHRDLDAGGRQLLAQASEAIGDGAMGYVAVVARVS